MTDTIFVDGPMHPDLFDGETPVRVEVDLGEVPLKVYKVDCTYYEPETETHFVVAETEGQAEEKAWQNICCEETMLDSTEVEALDLNAECRDFLGRNTGPDGTCKTARDLLVEHIEEHGCTLTPS